MKDRKRVQLDVHMFEIPELCAYFHDMAIQGWMLTTLMMGTAVFKRVEPIDVNFYIAFAQKYSYFTKETKISETDEDFTKFVESYGLTTIWRTSTYQVYMCEKEVAFPFYDGTIKQYLQDNKKRVLRYEAFKFIIPILLSGGMIASLYFQQIGFFRNSSILFYLLMLPFWVVYSITSSSPIFTWLKKKERYTTTIKIMRYRSQLLNIVWPVPLMSFVGSSIYFTLGGILPALFILIPWLVIIYFGIRLVCMKREGYIRLLLTTVAMLNACCLCYFIFIQSSRNESAPVIADMAPTEVFTSALVQEYDYKNLEDSKKIIRLHISQNKFFDDAMIRDTIEKFSGYLISETDTYQFYGSTYRIHMLVFDHKILTFYGDDISTTQIQNLLVPFDL